MPLILGTNSIKDTGYNVANSLRFDSVQGTYLNFDQGTATSARKMTYSTWFKLSKTNDYNILLENVASPHNSQIVIQDDGNNNDLRFYDYDGSTNIDIRTSQAIRDTSAWYHIVVAMDTTQSTASNRVKIYINGSQVTSLDYATYPSQNYDTGITNGDLQIGRQGTSSYYLDGYLAETIFVDGQQLDPTSFGEFDEDTPTIWKPKQIDVSSITFGNNGFYLNYRDSSALGNDVSGNDNDLTANNITSLDQSIDTCTNNFATMNPLSKGSDITITEGNLKVSNGSSDNSILGNIGFGNGKWYWEAKCTGATTYANIGVTLASKHGGNHSDVDSGRVVYSHNGNVYKEGLGDSATDTGTTFTTNDIVSVAYDAQNGSVKFYKNGTLVNTTTDSDLEFSTNEFITSVGINEGGFELNFGSPIYSISSGNSDANGYGNFEYAVPSGYYSLCTKNLAEFG